MRARVLRSAATAVLLVGAAVAPLGAQASAIRVGTGLFLDHHVEAAAALENADLEELSILEDLLERRGVRSPRTKRLMSGAQSFRRGVLGILADPGVTDRSSALAEAVAHYSSERDALPAQPKSMDVLYDHDSALAFRRAEPEAKGRLWSAHWYRLALTEPLADLPHGALRAAGVDTVAARFAAKLAEGEPPHTYPSELPLAPAIAPGLILASAEAAMIWDNLAMLTEVLVDILSDPSVLDVEGAIDDAIDHFTTPGVAITGPVMWETMALRHGIFFQGGYPLAVMTESERNTNGHAMHMRSGRGAVIPGMVRR